MSCADNPSRSSGPVRSTIAASEPWGYSASPAWDNQPDSILQSSLFALSRVLRPDSTLSSPVCQGAPHSNRGLEYFLAGTQTPEARSALPLQCSKLPATRKGTKRRTNILALPPDFDSTVHIRRKKRNQTAEDLANGTHPAVTDHATKRQTHGIAQARGKNCPAL